MFINQGVTSCDQGCGGHEAFTVNNIILNLATTLSHKGNFTLSDTMTFGLIGFKMLVKITRFYYRAGKMLHECSIIYDLALAFGISDPIFTAIWEMLFCFFR